MPDRTTNIIRSILLKALSKPELIIKNLNSGRYTQKPIPNRRIPDKCLMFTNLNAFIEVMESMSELIFINLYI
tara:strand:- start:137 stop:355 length:219 start_codon:yes stop_codon:yes gene_type:complete